MKESSLLVVGSVAFDSVETRVGKRVEVLGGRMRTPIRTMGGARYCVIEDVGGAMCALYQSAPKET